MLSAHTEHIYLPNSKFLNPIGWILKCVRLELKNFQKSPSEDELNCYILLMSFLPFGIKASCVCVTLNARSTVRLRETDPNRDRPNHKY